MHHTHMRRAIVLSQQAVHTNLDGSFGAVGVRVDQVVVEGFNSVTSDLDPTAHTKATPIRVACRTLRTCQLMNCGFRRTVSRAPCTLDPFTGWASLTSTLPTSRGDPVTSSCMKTSRGRSNSEPSHPSDFWPTRPYRCLVSGGPRGTKSCIDNLAVEFRLASLAEDLGLESVQGGHDGSLNPDNVFRSHFVTLLRMLIKHSHIRKHTPPSAPEPRGSASSISSACPRATSEFLSRPRLASHTYGSTAAASRA